MTETAQIEEALSVRAQKEQPLYAGRVQVYPKSVAGIFRRLKWAVLVALLGLYYVLPWIRWDRGPDQPDQAVLADIEGQRLYFFFIEIWPQEIYYLAGLLILGAVGLFLVTSLAGRVWCGYACPQTVWTDLYMWVERLIQGDRNARIKLDKAPFGANKVLRKTLTHAVWLVIAAATGGIWIMYFNDAPTVVRDIFTGQASLTVYGFTGLFTGTTYLLAGWAREQVCTYMCPWPRFQAAMFDEDSLIVTYQGWRGEPRGRHRKGDGWKGRGDCIDCNLCVAVCPTGIDIRDGSQMECIGCALCIDACNSVMVKVGRPGELITYDTDRNQQNRAAGKAPNYRLGRPRTVLYSVLFVVVAGLMLWSLLIRPSLDITVLRDRNPLFVALSDGSVRNSYTIKLLNMTREPRAFTLRLEEPAGAVMRVLGYSGGTPEQVLLSAKPDSVATFRVFVTLPRDSLDSDSLPLAFLLQDHERGEEVLHETVFRGPAR
jgi:cytochrome c oxidase accessory protein FixG